MDESNLDGSCERAFPKGLVHYDIVANHELWCLKWMPDFTLSVVSNQRGLWTVSCLVRIEIEMDDRGMHVHSLAFKKHLTYILRTAITII